MSWLNKIEPIVLHQGSDLPYVISKEGVKLCFDNMYSTCPYSSEFNLSFKVHRNNLKRQSANYFRFKEFPTIVPFHDVLKLDRTIIDGHVIKSARSATEKTLSLVIVKENYPNTMSDSTLSDLVDLMEKNDHPFILLTNEEMSPQIRLLDSFANFIQHSDYGRTIVQIAHVVCPNKMRKYCWTKTVPDLSIKCYGLESIDEKSDIESYFNYIGVENVEVTWED